MRLYWLLIPLAAAPLFGQVSVTCLANEGVLLTAGPAKVLVDALFRDSLGDYSRHSADVQERLETGKPPFDGVNLALATHYHLDHWDASAISRFLRLNPAARFASTPEGVAMMPSAVRARVQGFAAPHAALDLNGVRVQPIPLRHGGTPHLAYRIEMGGRVLVHLGDADPHPENFARLLEGPAPHVVLAPFWWALDEKGLEFLVTRWKPRQVMAFHFGADDVAKSAPVVRTRLPDAWLCIQPGEPRTY